MMENASEADLVAEVVVVEASTVKELNFRYVAEKDVKQMVAVKKRICLMKGFRI